MLLNRSYKLNRLATTIIVPTLALNVNANPASNFEEAFSTTVVLTDNESVTLGVGNFSPDELIKNHNFTSSDPSVELRNQMSVLSLPYTWKFNDLPHSDTLTAQLSYFKQDSTLIHDIDYEVASTSDVNIDKVYSASLTYSRYIAINNNWLFKYSLEGYLMHYSNHYQYNNEFSQSLQPKLNGIYFNTQANALLIEPKIKLTYVKLKPWGKWQFITNAGAFSGKTFAGSDSSQKAKPTGWQINNGVKLHFNVNTGKFHAESLYVKIQRSDIGGDIVRSLDTKHFYEFGIGVLLDTQKFTSLAENIGIGININRGSSLSGGSIVFYFNEI